MIFCQNFYEFELYLVGGLKPAVVRLFAAEIREGGGGGPQHKVMLPQVARVEQVRSEQGCVTRQIAHRHVEIATVLNGGGEIQVRLEIVTDHHLEGGWQYKIPLEIPTKNLHI